MDSLVVVLAVALGVVTYALLAHSADLLWHLVEIATRWLNLEKSTEHWCLQEASLKGRSFYRALVGLAPICICVGAIGWFIWGITKLFTVLPREIKSRHNTNNVS